MKKTLTLGTLLLGCCLAALHRRGAHRTRLRRVHSVHFPQDQTGQTPSNPVDPGRPIGNSAAIQNASGSMATDQASNSQVNHGSGLPEPVLGGNFMLADNSGNNYPAAWRYFATQRLYRQGSSGGRNRDAQQRIECRVVDVVLQCLSYVGERYAVQRKQCSQR